MFLVDTNVLVYAIHPSGPEHAACRSLLEQARTGPAAWYTTWGIVYEFLRVSTHPRLFSDPWDLAQAWRFVSGLLGSPNLTVLTETARHAEVATQVFDGAPALKGNILHDAHTAILMREHGVRRIYTHDADFHRFPFLEVIDPLSGAHSGKAKL